MYTLWLIAGAAYLLSIASQKRLKAQHRKWGSIRNSANVSGAEAARTILDANGLGQVNVQPVRGQLSDHYDPRFKSVRLSEVVYAATSIEALAVAAHEAGHAIQDKVRYWPLAVRSSVAPIVNLAAKYGIPLAILGSIMGQPVIAQLGLGIYMGALAFQFITLPVEFDASKRALEQLDRLRLLSPDEKEGARSMLRAAAMTYVAGAATAAVYILYLVWVAGRWIFRLPPPIPPPRLP